MSESWKELWGRAQEADRSLVEDFNAEYSYSMPPLEVRIEFLKHRLDLTQAMLAQVYNKLIEEEERKSEAGSDG